MTSEFDCVSENILQCIRHWEALLLQLPEERLTKIVNRQNRSIKQIIGHLIDSASNNHQRFVRLQYVDELHFPDYTSLNDRWIAIQHFQEADIHTLVQLWKYFNLHIIHIINHIDKSKSDNFWIDEAGIRHSLAEMIHAYLDHLLLHLSEIEELVNYHSHP